MEETSNQRFKRLAEKRVNVVIKTVRLIGNLSNRSNYTYTESDVEKIFSAINAELKSCRGKFSTKGSGKSDSFKLD